MRALLVLMICAPAFAASAESAVQPGRWTYTMKTVVPGVPFPLGTVTQSLCLQDKEARYGVARVKDGDKGACHFENWHRTGNVTRYDMVCPQNAGVGGTFEYTTSGQSVTGKGVIRSGTSEIIQQWEGHRIGDC